MAKVNTKKIDREIALAERKLAAARNGEHWPLTASERRKILTALAGGGYKVARGKSPGRGERKLAEATAAIESRLSAELAALRTAKANLIKEAAEATVAKKLSSGWSLW